MGPSVARDRRDSLPILFLFLTIPFTPQPLPPPRTFIPQSYSSGDPNLTPLGFPCEGPCSPSFCRPKAWMKPAPGPCTPGPFCCHLPHKCLASTQTAVPRTSPPLHPLLLTPELLPGVQQEETFPSWSFGNNLTHFPRRWSQASRAFW